MQILVRGTTKEHPVGQFFSIITDVGGALVFQLGEHSPDGDNINTVLHGQVTLDLKTLFKPRTFFNVFGINRVTPGRKGIVELSGPIDTKSRERGLVEDVFHRDVLTMLDKIPLIVVYFHDSQDDVTIMINKDIDADTSNVVFEEAARGKSIREIVFEEKPELISYYNICLARQKMVRSSDPNASLAYIEAQLDILTRLVMRIIEGNPSLNADISDAFPQLQQFADIINNSSLLNVKTVEKCLAEISETKARIRGLQVEYFAAKEANK